MRWIVLAKLPLENPKSDPDPDKWALEPTFYRDEGSEEDGRLFWSVNLFHCHWDNPDNPGNSPPDRYHCGLVNRDQVLNNKPKASPEYQCDKCGKSAPQNVVREKIERQFSLKGVDPRNDRRGAVLATRKRELTDTEES